MTQQLEPITPRDALDLYLEDITGDLSPNSVRAKRYQLGFFASWCEGADNDGEPRVENLNDITGRDFTRFKHWRGENIGNVTLRTNMSALRTFMRYCVRIDAVHHAIPEKIDVPELDYGENHNEEYLDHETAQRILDYWRTYEYASFDHVLLELQWTTGMRMSGLHSLDVDDVDRENNTLTPKHHPDEGTRLKNGYGGERVVTLDSETMTTLANYIDVQRTETTDDHGRHPLFSSKHGRMSKQHLNKHLYATTTPCQVGMECPEGRDPLECEYTGSLNRLLECPHNTRPHAVRAGSITYWLRDDTPTKAVSDRVNSSVKTLDKHYDERSEVEKAEQRRELFNGD